MGTGSSNIGIRRAMATSTLELGCDRQTVSGSRGQLEYNDDPLSLKSETCQRGGDAVLGRPAPFREIRAGIAFPDSGIFGTHSLLKKSRRPILRATTWCLAPEVSILD